MNLLRTKAFIPIAAMLLLVSLCGCMTSATLGKARGYTKDDGHSHKEAREEPQPNYFALVPLAFVGDVATLPVQGFWVVFVWPFLPPDVRERLDEH